jgi:Tol biopolymer transport system component
MKSPRYLAFVIVSLLASTLLALCPSTAIYAQDPSTSTATGQRFLARDNDGTFVLDLTTGTRFPLANFSRAVQAADWSPDGTKIAAVAWRYDEQWNFFTDVLLFDQAGNFLQACSDSPGCGPLTHAWESAIRWSPDGSKLVIAIGSNDDKSGELVVIDADFQHDKLLVRMNSSIEDPSWSPDGKSLIFMNQTYPTWDSEKDKQGIYTINADGNSPARLLVDNTTYANSVNAVHASFSPAGDKLAVVEPVAPPHPGPSDIFIRDADGSNPRRLTFNGGRMPQWSPDGSRIAFVTYLSNTGTDPTGLYIVNVDGSNLTKLNSYRGGVFYFGMRAWKPAWSPDGTKLALGLISHGLPLSFIDVTGANPVTLAGLDFGADRPWQPQANVLSNPGFEVGPIYWRFNTNGQAAFSTASPGFGSPTAGRVAVTQRTSTIQLFQTGVRLEPNTRYRLRFQAYSNSGRDFSVYLHNHTTIVDYGLKNYKVNLTKSWKQFTITFKTKNITEPVADGRLRFWFGPYARAGDVYWIDNVVLEKVPTTVVAAASAATGSVTGQVDAGLPAGQPATLTLVDLESAGTAFHATATTDASGSFRFDGVPHGEYELRLTAPAEAAAQEAVQLSVSEEENESILFAPAATEPALFLPVITQE